MITALVIQDSQVILQKHLINADLNLKTSNYHHKIAGRRGNNFLDCYFGSSAVRRHHTEKDDLGYRDCRGSVRGNLRADAGGIRIPEIEYHDDTGD